MEAIGLNSTLPIIPGIKPEPEKHPVKGLEGEVLTDQFQPRFKEAEHHDPVKHRERIKELEELVLTPKEVTLEDRLAQVMSLDDIKRLLLIMGPVSRTPFGQEEKGTRVDFTG